MIELGWVLTKYVTVPIVLVVILLMVLRSWLT